MKALLLLALALWVAAPVASQELREYQVGRGRRGETAMRAIVDFAAGDLFVRPSADRSLYAMDLSYDPTRYRPVDRWDPERGVIHLGVEKRDEGDPWPRKDPLAQRAVISLSPDIDLTLDANLGAAASSLELGGLRLVDLAVSTGASDTELRFSKPNEASCGRAQITTGAAAFTGKRLGNAGCRAWVIEGGVGAVRLDLTGDWPESSRMQITMAVGEIRLEIPRDLGIRITMDRFLSSFSQAGLSKRGNTYQSDNYGSATRKLDLDIDSTLGNVRIEWR